LLNNNVNEDLWRKEAQRRNPGRKWHMTLPSTFFLPGTQMWCMVVLFKEKEE
jgi:hypothetical protein